MTHHKEINYFSSNWDRGSRWYSDLFLHGEEQCTVDISPSYFVDQHAPKRIADHSPDAKIFLIARNPIERIYSHFCMLFRGAAISEDFHFELIEKRRLVEEGMYWNCIRRYEAFLGNERVRVFLFDDLQENPVKFWEEVCSYLEIDPHPKPELVEKKLHIRRQPPRSRLIHKIGAGAVKRIYNAGRPGRFIADFVRTGTLSQIFHRLNSVGDFPQMDDEVKNSLIEIYRSDVCELSEHLKRDLLKDWLS